MSYDLTAAADFLQYEAGIPPRELYNEVCGAIRDLSRMERAKSRETRYECFWNVFHTLHLFADLAEHLIPEEAQRENNRA